MNIQGFGVAAQQLVELFDVDERSPVFGAEDTRGLTKFLSSSSSSSGLLASSFMALRSASVTRPYTPSMLLHLKMVGDQRVRAS